MDPWKATRLWLCIAVCVGFLAVGGYARLVRGVPFAPYGYCETGEWTLYDGQITPLMTPASLDPFVRLQQDIEPIRDVDVRLRKDITFLEPAVSNFSTGCPVRVRTTRPAAER